MNTTSNSVSKNTNDTNIKLWIDNDFYIPVDSKGFCNGTCYEGALGYIIQLKSDDGKLAALKIPKLTGDTFRENAYISELMEKELYSVGKIFGGGEVTGLLNPFGSSSPLRNTISTDGGPDEAKEWHGSRVFVSYHKGKNPQFALVKRNGQKHIFPEVSDLKLKDNSVEELYKSLEDYIRELEKKKNNKQVIFIDFQKNQSPQDTTQECNGLFQVFSIANAPEHTDSIWCTFLPSVTYGWAPGTLQEAISLSKCGKWSILDHIDLMINLCLGLTSLHSRGMLHADLRPANIIYRGNPTKTTSYAIADYGSLAESNPHPSPTPMPSGSTILGPILTGERSSVFYSPERQSGQEREAADTAIIYRTNLPAGAAGSFYVVLGWRSELLTNEKVNSQLIERLIGKDSSSSKEQISSNSDNSYSLCKGDRIQVRDYIFELDEEEQNKEGKQILRCSKIWKVYQGKITVRTTILEEFRSEETYVSFPIPRTVELRQWSAASDLYSLGAIMLYSLCNQYRLENSDTENQHGSKTVELEKDFRDMMNILGSTPYFKSIWPEIQNLRRNLEDIIKLSNNTYGNRIDEQYIKWLDKDGQTQDVKFSSLNIDQIKKIRYEYDAQSQSGKDKTLEEAVLEVARLITQTVPGIRNILKAVKFDTGRFIFLIHFILCCLHKSSDINFSDPQTEVPFVKDRLEQPIASQTNAIASQTNAIDKALERLDTLQKSILPAILLNQFISKDSDIPEFNPRPDTTIRLTLEQASNKLDELLKREHLIPRKYLGLRPDEQQLKKDLEDILNLLGKQKRTITDDN